MEKRQQTLDKKEFAEKTRYSVSTPREYETKDGAKTYWTTIGSAFRNDKGNITVLLDASPINGKLFINLTPAEKTN